PSVARAKMDFRLVPEQDPVKLAGRLRQHLSRHGFGDVEVALQAENPAARTPINSPIAKIAAKTARDVLHRHPVTLVSSAIYVPMHYFTHTLKLPTVAHARNDAH